MLALPKIEAVYHQLFGQNPVRTTEDWETYMKRLVYLKLAKVDEIACINPSHLIYPLTMENVLLVLKNKFGNSLLSQAVEENTENLIRIREIKELVKRWEQHSLSNDELIILLQMKEKFSQNLAKQKHILSQSKQGISKLSEPLIQVKELIYTENLVKTSFDFVR